MMSSENQKDSENSEINQKFSSEQDEIMDVLNRNALLRCRTKIVKDLDVRLIIDSLIETKVIDTNFYEQLKGQVCNILIKVIFLILIILLQIFIQAST